MANVLIVAAFQLGPPMSFIVYFETDYPSFHKEIIELMDVLASYRQTDLSAPKVDRSRTANFMPPVCSSSLSVCLKSGAVHFAGLSVRREQIRQVAEKSANAFVRALLQTPFEAIFTGFSVLA
jgi:hypothetical protein